MKHILLLFLACPLFLAAQDDTLRLDDTTNNDLIVPAPDVDTFKVQTDTMPDAFMKVEQMPEFPGGEEALLQYLARVDYPKLAIENDIQGIVFTQFIIEKDGTVSSVEILRGADKILDDAVLAHIRNMPKWKPGYERGKPVRVKMSVPTRFIIYGGSDHRVYENPEEMPQFGQSSSDLENYLSQVKYPKSAIKKGIEGTVIVSFIVQKDGSVSHVAVAESVNPSLDKAAEKHIRKMPYWKPGMNNGTPVKTRMDLPVKFKLK